MDFLKRYNITLQTIGPVYIGSGNQLKKKEWIKDRKNKLAIIPDNLKLFEFLGQKGLMKAYQDYMLKQNMPLDVWLRQNNINSKEIDSVTGYVLDASSIVDLNQQSDINTFIKDGYGLPYVPGSSLKGAIRNIILAQMITDDGTNNRNYAAVRDEIFQPTERKSKKFLKREANRINQKFFYTRNLLKTDPNNAVNDMMRGLRVSDSKPLALSDLTLCQKIDMMVDDKENSIKLLRECLKPGTFIEFEMTIDTTETDLNVNYITKSINGFLKQYNEMFLKKYHNEELYDKDVIYIGGGVGMASKTVINQVFQNDRDRVKLVSKVIDNTLNNKNRKKHKHFRDEGLGVSPHTAKLTEYEGNLYQFGPCKIEITPK